MFWPWMLAPEYPYQAALTLPCTLNYAGNDARVVETHGTGSP